MRRPDFREIRALIGELEHTDRSLGEVFSKTEQTKEQMRALVREAQEEHAAGRLREIPVEELKQSRAGIRTPALAEAGYEDLFSLYRAGDEEIAAVPGVGEKQVAAIRSITAGFLRRLSEHERITLEGGPLLTALARYRAQRQVVRDAEGLYKETHSFLTETVGKVRIRSAVRWIFSRRAAKEETTAAVGQLAGFRLSDPYARMQRFLMLFDAAEAIDEEEAGRIFQKESASFYALLESFTGPAEEGILRYGSIPEQLAAKISMEEVDLHTFRGDLRAYQKFGVQYILHQKKVLLGDEMGLGKTVQAIAAMAHLSAHQEKAYFLVVCPASVMVNWQRELERFSELPVFLLHGEATDKRFSGWEESGGAAVTNYESMLKLAGRIDRKMQLSLLVIDEAHYIKNPSAKRTRQIRRLEEESERILLMTGTPIENHVSEMCELIDFVRPDMTQKIREQAGLRHLKEFREMLSPVYLRRRAQEVLSELPPITWEDEWCALTPEDRAAYADAVRDGNFMAMRRVSYLQEDLKTSAKANRLLELLDLAVRDGRKVVVFSWFRETIGKVEEFLRGSSGPEAGIPYIGILTGSTSAMERQNVIDSFGEAEPGSVLVCQVQAGGTGVNLQAASAVIFCEPQIKPSLEKQAAARVHRMGQTDRVLAIRLISEDTVDEAILPLLEKKQEEFDAFAEESAAADAAAALADQDWIRAVVEEERQKYLPAVQGSSFTIR